MSNLYHMHRGELPEHIISIPGVYRNQSGGSYRVPYNVFPLLGWETPAQFSDSVGERALSSALVCDRMKPEIAGLIREHQRRALAKAIIRPGFHIWAPPGAGKTLMGLTWAAWDWPGPRIVVTRAAARSTWLEENGLWTNMKPIMLLGQTPNVEITKDPNAIYITAWETLIYWADAIMAANPGSIVFDEIHMGKAHKRVQGVLDKDGKTKWTELENMTNAASQIAKKSGRRLGLTATPLSNLVKDLWAQLDLGEPWQYGPFSQFGTAYCDGQHNGYGMEYKGYSGGEELTARLKWSKFRITQASIAKHMPPKRRQVTRLERSEQDQPEGGFARDIKTAGKAAASGSEEGREALFEVLLQEAATRKRKYVVEQVTDALKSGLKVVVFTGRRRDCDVLGDAIRKAAPANATVRVAHGGHPDSLRDSIRWEYMGNAEKGIPRAAGPFCIVGTGDAWGESVNLQDTDIAFFVMIPYTPRRIRQWEGRFQRMGGVRPVLIRYIVARGTVDEDVADTLLGKLPPVVEIVEDEELEGMEQAFRPREVGDLLARMTAISDARNAETEEETAIIARARGGGSVTTPPDGLTGLEILDIL